MTNKHLHPTVLLATAFYAIFSFHSFAGTATGMGRGGNAVVCFNQPVFRNGEPAFRNRGPVVRTRVELFDYWEKDADIDKPLHLNMGPDQTNYIEMARFVIKRIARFEPARSERLLGRIDEFLNDATLEDLVKLPAVRDFSPNQKVTEANCYTTQFAIQYFDPRSKTSNFTIDRELFLDPLTDNFTKAGIILHEVLYEEALRNSVNPDLTYDYNSVRSFNRKISSDFLDHADALDYYYLLAGDGYDSTEEIVELNLMPFNTNPENPRTQELSISPERWITYSRFYHGRFSPTIVHVKVDDLLGPVPNSPNRYFGSVLNGHSVWVESGGIKMENTTITYIPLIPRDGHLEMDRFQNYNISGLMRLDNDHLLCISSSDSSNHGCTVSGVAMNRDLKVGESIPIR